jgi:hypothetical protein
LIVLGTRVLMAPNAWQASKYWMWYLLDLLLMPTSDSDTRQHVTEWETPALESGTRVSRTNATYICNSAQVSRVILRYPTSWLALRLWYHPYHNKDMFSDSIPAFDKALGRGMDSVLGPLPCMAAHGRMHPGCGALKNLIWLDIRGSWTRQLCMPVSPRLLDRDPFQTRSQMPHHNTTDLSRDHVSNRRTFLDTTSFDIFL